MKPSNTGNFSKIYFLTKKDLIIVKIHSRGLANADRNPTPQTLVMNEKAWGQVIPKLAAQEGRLTEYVLYKTLHKSEFSDHLPVTTCIRKRPD